MAQYAYKARDAQGQPLSGMIIAESEVDLANRLAREGCALTQAREISDEEAGTLRRRRPSGQHAGKLKPKEVLLFTTSLATFVSAGLPLLQGLQSLAQSERRTRSRALVEDLVKRIQAGHSLNGALAAHPGSFSPLYLALVDAGESTGKLDVILNELARMLESELDLKTKIREAAAYPVILCLAMVGVVTLLLVKVIPVFVPIFTEAGVALPVPTRILLRVSGVIAHAWPAAIAVVIAGVIAYRAFHRTKAGGPALDRAILRLPLLGGLAYKMALARFFYTLRLSLQAGINVIQALRFSGNVMGNLWLSYAVGQTERAVRIGQDLQTSLAHAGVFPPLVLRMVAVGEQSGSLVECLEKVSQFYEKEIPMEVKRIFAAFEPLMIIAMGVVVGGIALCLFLPLSKMVGVISGG